MKKLLGITVLIMFGILNSAKSDDPCEFFEKFVMVESLKIETSHEQKYIIDLYPKNNFCNLRNDFNGSGCNYIKNGSKFYVNINDSSFTLEGKKILLTKKFEGKWKSRDKEFSKGTFWGTFMKIPVLKD